MRWLLLVAVLSLASSLPGQGEGNHWYFGSFAGIDFNSGQAVAVNDGALSTREGCSTISDEEGNLLMYTDGVKVWNRLHQVMPNGAGLKGNTTTTQSGLIVKKPGSDHLFYVFTVGKQANSDGLQYNVVDLNLDGGLGDVISKNNPIYAPTPEKVTAVRHNNGEDIWIVSHDWVGNHFLAFLLTKNGLNTTPVISQAGIVHSGGSINACAVGQMKCNPQGNKLAVAIFENVGAEVFDFDNKTGKVSNKITLPLGPDAYGVEFSPNGCLLYIACGEGLGSVHQFNLEAGTAQDIWNSDTIISQFGNHAGQLQLAPDGRIYMAQFGEAYLSVIENPNMQGLGCNFVTNGFSLSLSSSLLGLPNYFSEFNPEIVAWNFCRGDTTYFEFSWFKPGVQLTWDFGDPITGQANTATGPSVFHVFSDTGAFYVHVLRNNNGVIDTFDRKVIIQHTPALVISPDTTICPGDKATLRAEGFSPGTTYRWSNGAITPTTVIDQPGTYVVKVQNTCGKNTDSVQVSKYPLNYQVDPEVIGCYPQSATVEIELDTGLMVTWPDGSNGKMFSVSNSQEIVFLVQNGMGCQIIDSLKVSIYHPTPPDLGSDTVICNDSILILSIDPSEYTSWQWSDGSNTPEIEVSESATIVVMVEDQHGCVSYDTLTLSMVECSEVLIAIPNAFTPNGDGLNDGFKPITRGVEITDFYIFNRWGEQIFRSHDSGWDGNYKGTPVPIGSYAFIVYYRDNSNQLKIESGNVTLIR